MKRLRLKISESDFAELQRLVFADMPNEAGAFALAGAAEHEHGTDFLIRRVVSVPRECVQLQQEYRLEICSRAVNGLAGLCEANGLGAMLCHSHPTDSPYSPSDDHGESRVVETLRHFIPHDAPTVSLLFTPGSVIGRVWLRDKPEPVPLNEIRVIGRCIKRIVVGSELMESAPSESYDRQVRAFGCEGQASIQKTRVGIVGVGGTGSPTAEQLVRLGVDDLILIDPDEFSSSNLSRVYGSFAPTWLDRLRSLGRATLKVDVVARHLRRINPSVRIRTIAQNVVRSEAAMALRDRDVIFLCTDDHWGRAVVNQIAYQYLIPAINIGTSICSRDGWLTQAIGVVDVLRPNSACLWCKQFLNPDRIAAESMPLRDRRKRAHEGYVQGIDTPTPSVISITTMLSAMAVNAFLQLVTDLAGDLGGISRLNADMLSGSVRRGTTNIADRCVCREVNGFGDLRALATVSEWPGTRRHRAQNPVESLSPEPVRPGLSSERQ